MYTIITKTAITHFFRLLIFNFVTVDDKHVKMKSFIEFENDPYRERLARVGVYGTI